MKKRTAAVALALAMAFPRAALADDGGAPFVSVDATCSDGDGVGASVDPGASPSVPPASANGQITDAITKSGGW